MPNPEYFRRQADICLRLSLIASDDEVSNRLLTMARSYMAKGDALEREGVGNGHATADQNGLTGGHSTWMGGTCEPTAARPTAPPIASLTTRLQLRSSEGPPRFRGGPRLIDAGVWAEAAPTRRR
jgi:hypothetical protein